MNTLCSQDFFKPTKYNNETKNQLWMSVLADTHDCICCCDTPFAHLLASIFPPDHRDRQLTIQEIIERDYKECHFGGKEERSGGGEGAAAASTSAGPPKENIKEEEITDEELSRLIAAAEDAQKR